MAMKFENGYSQKVNGTSLKGHITASYAKLVEAFGPPTHDGDGYKTDAEWTLEFEDGTIATIYNWKNGRNYCGAAGMPVEMITEWNIGGHDGDAYQYVLEKIL
jgi:hypothetical protein